jgi:hypothetical protein
MPIALRTKTLAVFVAISLLFGCVALRLIWKEDVTVPIRLESLLVLTNTPYAILSMPRIRETYAFTKNSGLPIHIDEHYWKWTGSNRIAKSLPPDGVFWTETNGMAFAHIPLEKEAGQYQLEYFMHRRLWLAGKHIGPRFAEAHFASSLIPNADLYLSTVATNKPDRH